MSRKFRRGWLVAVLLLLLGLLVAALWLGGRAPESERKTQAVSSSVVFEDAERMHRNKVARSVVAPTAVKKKKHATGIALILDDVGYDLAALRRALGFHWPMAISVLPDAPHAAKAAELAHEAGHLVMLHMPMEPANPHYRETMDEGFLRVGMNRSQVREIMERALIRVPFVEGVNNHMGSRLTELEEPMRWVMQVCREQKLFFVDSRTSKDSVAASAARKAGIRWGERRVFLDDSVEPDKLRQSWRRVKKRLVKDGYVIVIAHPHRESLDFLARLSTGDKALMTPLEQVLFPASK